MNYDREALTKRIIEEAYRGLHPDLPTLRDTMDRIWERQAGEQKKEGKR